MGATTLQPGESTTVRVSMMMHSGMEGSHLFKITVPVRGDGTAVDVMELFVKAHFG